MVSIEKITVPDLGDATEVEVIELLVTVGQAVEENDSLLVLESDKAAMEIPAPMSGVVKSIAVNLGDQVTTGHEMLSLEVEGSAAPAAEPASEEAQPAPAVQPEPEPEPKIAEASEAVEPAPQPAKSEAAKTVVVEVPDLGTDDEVEVIEVHIKAGDEISVDQELITLESDKAAMEVPSPFAGTVEALMVKVGDKLKTGSPILQLLSSSADAVATAPVAAPAPAASASPEVAVEAQAAPEPTAQPAAEIVEAVNGGDNARLYAGPAVRKLARELGVDLHQVTGSGAKSRILKEDLHDFVKARINTPAAAVAAPGVSAVPDIDFSQFGEIEQVKRSKLQKLTAQNMHRSWSSIPHVAQFNEADVTDLEDFRASLKGDAERRGSKLTFMPFLLKACANALQEYPQFNVSLHSSGEYAIQKKYIHIGMAVATEAGLMVPVIKNVDQKTIWQLADEVIELSNKAKQRKLSREEMQGACFTISSLGAIGGTGFIPIVNAPEVAILGVGKTTIKPVYIAGEFKPRKMLPITLSYDHKAVNGVDGGLFSTHLAKVLADIRHLSL